MQSGSLIPSRFLHCFTLVYPSVLSILLTSLSFHYCCLSIVHLSVPSLTQKHIRNTAEATFRLISLTHLLTSLPFRSSFYQTMFIIHIYTITIYLNLISRGQIHFYFCLLLTLWQHTTKGKRLHDYTYTCAFIPHGDITLTYTVWPL